VWLLHSQEHLCREYAATRVYIIDNNAIFHDDVSGGGDFKGTPNLTPVNTKQAANLIRLLAEIELANAQPWRRSNWAYESLEDSAREWQSAEL